MIVTTTNSIEGREISRYNDPIAANVVIGTNVFNDIGASYVGIFLGKLKLLKSNGSIVRYIFTTIYRLTN
ncbi:heavy metal-binding domain-containing protein [Sphingobacterium siyangense]|uniref:heavy metal-binding domain-containing protein n=1 Tax=Sphingobacterium siyangense TaxID=459529 RepID=UPI0019663AB7|nr:heavy metal-binding domain-containing protein [Sphingobacterium siyangense]QRY55254.1 heavy metal-binding domain-containing protein [Sphingobacterium siyangense]